MLKSELKILTLVSEPFETAALLPGVEAGCCKHLHVSTLLVVL